MKGITTHVMVIIFSLIIMVVLLVIGIGFVQNYTNIPFEKLWELTPQSGVASEPTYSSTGGGGSASDILATRFFTTSGPYDLSEIACDIGTAIYKDYKSYGDSSRPTTSYGDYIYGYPIGNSEPVAKKAILIGAGSFLYHTGTNTMVDDSVFGGNGCHICREPEITGNPPAVGGIKDLDEVCINMQLRDRTIGTGAYFCGNGLYQSSPLNGRALIGGTRDGTFNIPGIGDVQFGNCIMGATTTTANNQAIQNAIHKDWSGDNGFSNGHDGAFCVAYPWCNCGNEQYDFCDNSEDRITWSAQIGKTANNWEAIEQDNLDNDNNLVDNRNYIYGVYWVPGDNQYTIDFVLIPSGAGGPFNDFSQITTGNYFGDGNDRYNILGENYKDARTSAIFNVKIPTGSTVTILSLRTAIANDAGIDVSKVDCASCNSEPEPSIKSISNDYNNNDCPPENTVSNFKNSNIDLWTNATLPGGGPVGANDALQGGTYTVIIRNWVGLFTNQGCWKDEERSVSIYQISQSQTSCTGLGTCMSNSGNGCQANGGHNMGQLDCPANQICCA